MTKCQAGFATGQRLWKLFKIESVQLCIAQTGNFETYFPTFIHRNKLDTVDHTILLMKLIAYGIETEYQAQISTMIVPVRLCHEGNLESEVLVYALLDDQSNTSFVVQSLLDNIAWCEGSQDTERKAIESMESHRVDGLVIDDLHHNTQIKLQRSFFCTSIPARRSQIPRLEMANKWSHLTNIASDIPAYHHNVEVALSIRTNCPRAIMPRQVIPGPSAQLTELGSGIIGNVYVDESSQNAEDAGVVHRTVTAHVPKGNGKDERECTFAIKTTVKELINLKQVKQVRQMMEYDLSEVSKSTRPLLMVGNFSSSYEKMSAREATDITRCPFHSVSALPSFLTKNFRRYVD
jgi:hypothetical protein